MAKTLTITMTIELPESVTDYADPEWAAVMTLRDALSEFESHRMPTADYLDKRYPPNEYRWLNREKKAAQLNERIFLAQAMNKAIHSTTDISTKKESTT